MHDAVPMRVVERLGNVDGMAQDLVGWQGTAGKAAADRLAFQQLHHDVVAAVLLADVIQRADMRVIQTGNGSRFALEPLVGHAAVGSALRGAA